MKAKIALSALIGISFVAGLAVATNPVDLISTGKFTSQAEARIGRPMTPGSVAGVARRTTRRHIRRSTIYHSTLPRGCTQIIIEGTSLWLCGATYYQPYNNQYVVVYVN
jgi:hypothetical protein